jgi:hypothetical protein
VVSEWGRLLRGEEEEEGDERECVCEEGGEEEKRAAVAGGDLAIAFVINNYRHRAVIQ